MLPENNTSLSEDPRRFRLIRGLIIAVALSALVLAFIGSPLLSQWLSPLSGQANGAGLLTATPTPFQPSATPDEAASLAPTQTATLAPEIGGVSSLNGLMVVSVSEFGHAQLFSYQLIGEPYTRLTSGPWDDIHPALSADGSRLAFASNRGGQWDLYTLDLLTGETVQISDDAGYDGHPSWSVDNSWVTYEHSENGNLDIYIRPLDGSIEPVLISNHPGLDYAPAWRPGFQQIAFLSDRGGQHELWLLDLEQSDDARFTLLASEGIGSRGAPNWSPNGERLAWAAKDGEVWQIYALDMNDPNVTHALGIGEQPHWSPDGELLLATFQTAHETYLSASALDGSLALAPQLLPGHFEGAAWSAGAWPDPLPGALRAAAEAEPEAGWADALRDDVQLTTERLQTAELDDVIAPFPELSEVAIAPFDALRDRAAQLLGWDALSNLENAFVPVNEPLPPARQQDWLYTGRAFTVHTGLLDAGWMVVIPEEFAGQTYWRVYLRSAADRGGLGRPLLEYPWDFAVRASGQQIPPGGWVDFTALAADFGFERLPALSNWRNYFPGALFNEFALTAGLSWEEAMLQLYSAEAVATASASDSP